MLGSSLQTPQRSATTCPTHHSSDANGEGRSEDWGGNFSFPKCLRKYYQRDGIGVTRCQDQKMPRCNSPLWNGFAVRPPPTTHLLTAAVGETPNSSRKSTRASLLGSTLRQPCLCLCASFSRSQTGHAGWRFQHTKKKWTQVSSVTPFRWISSSKRKAKGENISAAKWLNARWKY